MSTHTNAFLAVCHAVRCGALRLKPRERQFVLSLALESLGRGQAQGQFTGEPSFSRWAQLLGWRQNEVAVMFDNWRRAGWIAADVAEGSFRLAPDRLPGWADCVAVNGQEQSVLPLATPADLHKTVAEISQRVAAEISLRNSGAEISHRAVSATFKRSNVNTQNVQTFKRLDVERLNVERHPAEISQRVAAEISLRDRVRAFVGEEDWVSEQFWNSGLGWRGRLFSEEGPALEAALHYVTAVLGTKESRLKKTKGAMLWSEFQRRRFERTSK